MDSVWPLHSKSLTHHHQPPTWGWFLSTSGTGGTPLARVTLPLEHYALVMK
ncbi:MAG: hypothetical protein KBH09_18250 [Saprospiraceae bacterium]|nr:hypothetical protein [Saprospiraceae bacterium]